MPNSLSGPMLFDVNCDLDTPQIRHCGRLRALAPTRASVLAKRYDRQTFRCDQLTRSGAVGSRVSHRNVSLNILYAW